MKMIIILIKFVLKVGLNFKNHYIDSLCASLTINLSEIFNLEKILYQQ